MIPVSARWAGAVSGNHRPLHSFELWRTGTRLIANLAVTGGEVSKDASSWPRITASLTVADTTAATLSLLTPFGGRVRIYRGIGYPDNTREMLLLGDLDIVSARFTRPGGELELQLADPSAAISGDQLTGPRPMVNTTVGDAIADLIAGAAYYGTKAVTDQTSNSQTVRTAADYSVDGDRWDAIEQLADQCSAECFFTPARVPVLRPEPVLKPSPDALLYAGDGGTVTAMTSELSRAPNAVVVYGGPDATGKQIRGVAWDADPSSPTYTGSAYGRVVLVEDRPAPFASAAAANAAAASMLGRARTGVRAVEIECVPNPALEPGDTVEVRFVNGAKEKHLIRSVSVPLGPADRMTLRCSTTAYSTAGWP